MTRREFLKGTAGFVIACGTALVLPTVSDLFKAAPKSPEKLSLLGNVALEDTVGPLLVEGLEMFPLSTGAEIQYRGTTCFTVNDSGMRLLRLADGGNTLTMIAEKADLSDQMEAVADFFVTLGKAGYLQNEIEVCTFAVRI